MGPTICRQNLGLAPMADYICYYVFNFLANRLNLRMKIIRELSASPCRLLLINCLLICFKRYICKMERQLTRTKVILLVFPSKQTFQQRSVVLRGTTKGIMGTVKGFSRAQEVTNACSTRCLIYLYHC